MSVDDKKSCLCAIIVTYEPDPDVLLRLLAQISTQTDFLLIDNASSNAAQFIAHAQDTPRCIGVRRLDKNIGLASAMNRGLREVSAAAYGFAVLFDQDSQVPASFFIDMQRTYTRAQGLLSSKLAALGPRIVSLRNAKPMPFKVFSRLCKRSDRRLPSDAKLFEADFLISSGCMIALQYLDDIGMMKDEYFIDNIDLEWCFRASARGYALLGTDYALLQHSIGVDDDSALVRAGLIVSHSPLRSYYSTRNRFALYREAHAPWAWKLRDFPRFILKSTWLLLFSKQRSAYWQNIYRGWKDSKGDAL